MLGQGQERSRDRPIRIGCAAGFWGDTETAAPQLLRGGRPDYLVFDYLAEITMSIMAGAKLRGVGGAGYATDFVTRVMRASMKDALERNVRIVTNAGGVNPLGCRDALLTLAAELGVSPKIAVVLGDDLLPLRDALASEGVREMYSGQPLPAFLLSANAYLGAKGIVDALEEGADIVLTGRVVDSALVLGPLVHEHGIGWDDWDRLAQASLAGHMIECGAQATGGIFTDWEDVPGYENIGYPIVECHPDGRFYVEKPADTGGLITPAVIYEQVLYEIGDPSAYVLPDVVCDLRQVRAEACADGRVLVRGSKGRAPTPTYKVCATYPDGYKVDAGIFLAGEDAARKGERVGRALLTKIERLLVERGKGPFKSTRIDALGGESSYGAHARARATREVVVRIAASHEDRDALKLLLRELPQAGTSMAPGFATVVGGRPEPHAMLKLFSFMLDKSRVKLTLDYQGQAREVVLPDVPYEPLSTQPTPQTRYAAMESEYEVPLLWLAHGRSGDKGDTSNIGIIAREPRFVPLIGAALTEGAVASYLAHLLDPSRGRVRRFELPGSDSWNFVLEAALGGGGVASLRPDPQGKAHAQQLLAFSVPVPRALFDELSAQHASKPSPLRGEP